MTDWSTAVDPRRPITARSTTDWSRRKLAWIFISVALIWPFYSHLVENWISRIEMQIAMHQAEAQIAQMQQKAASASAELSAQLRAEAAQTAARDLRYRIAAVRVVGAIDAPTPVVIVDHLPVEGAAEAAETICAQASGWLRRSVKGTTLLIQRDRGQRPAADAGRVVCP